MRPSTQDVRDRVTASAQVAGRAPSRPRAAIAAIAIACVLAGAWAVEADRTFRAALTADGGAPAASADRPAAPPDGSAGPPSLGEPRAPR